MICYFYTSVNLNRLIIDMEKFREPVCAADTELWPCCDKKAGTCWTKLKFDGGRGWRYIVLGPKNSGDKWFQLDLCLATWRAAVEFLFLVVSPYHTLCDCSVRSNCSVSTGTIDSLCYVKSCEIEIHYAINWTLLLALGRLMVSWGCRRGGWHYRHEGINNEDEGELMHNRAL